MSNVPLHPTKGLNLRNESCQQCGKPTGRRIPIGALEKIYKCDVCGCQTQTPPDDMKCHCPEGTWLFERSIGELEQIPVGLCGECEEERDRQSDTVFRGGIYFLCTDCHTTGTFPKDHPFAKQTRREQEIEAPEICGVEITRELCPKCGKGGR